MSSNALLGYVGWTFLPNLATSMLQSLYYSITIRAGSPKPLPGTRIHSIHRKRIFTTVILAYLCYTIYEADHDLRFYPDFYSILSVPHSATDKAIKSRFRRLAALYHPDKASSSLPDGTPPGTSPDHYFVVLKRASDTLLSTSLRFAYDRFGPAALNYQHCSSPRDYIVAGLTDLLPTYIGSLVVLILLGVTGYASAGRYWRYMVSAGLVLLDVHVITRPYHTFLLTGIINPVLTTLTNHPPLLPYQMLYLARQISIAIFIAISQLGPWYVPETPAQQKTPFTVDPQQIARLEAIAQANDQEATRLLQLDMAPYIHDEAGMGDLRGRVREWLVQNTIRADAEVRDAMGRVVQRRKAAGGLVSQTG